MKQNQKFGVLFYCILSTSFFAMAQKQKSLRIKEIDSKKEVRLTEVSALLETHGELYTLDQTPWADFPYKPTVQFRIAHSNNAVWLKFYVREQNILAQHTEIHSAVSRDSCVEFFFDPLGTGEYYNFEFNCIGTPHLAYGPGRHEREFVDSEWVRSQIRIASSLGEEPFAEKDGGHQWEMVMVLPASVLTAHPDILLKGRTSKANFYKCGDDTALRHYVTWNPVGTPSPDYHRPEYFGTLVFE
ncbi:MAG: carbohydrate-binding family 9-like protein [Bacteroidota bacterium]